MDDLGSRDFPTLACDAVLLIDDNGVVIAACGDIPGRSGDSVGSALVSVFHDVADDIEERLHAARKSDVAGTPMLIARADRLVAVRFMQWHDGVLAFVADVTASQRRKLRDDALARLSHDLAFVLSAEGRIVAVTDPAARGLAHADWCQRDFIDLVHPDDRERALMLLTASGSDNEVATLRLSHADSTWRVIAFSVEHSKSGEVVIAGTDVTRSRAEAALVAAQQAVLDHLTGGADLPAALDAIARFVEAEVSGGPAAVYVAAGNELELGAGPSLPKGWTRSAFRIASPAPDEYDDAQPGVLQPLDGRVSEIAAEHRLGFGWSRTVRDDDGTLLGAILAFPGSKRFLTEIERGIFDSAAGLLTVAMTHDREILDGAERARRDPLTGLLDRRSLLDELESRRGSDTLIVLVKVRSVARLNETLGYPGGDTVLRAVATELQATVRARDVVGRLSGTSFAVVGAARQGANGVAAVVERISSAVTGRFAAAGQAVEVTCTVVSAVAHSDESGPALLVRAEALVAGHNADSAVSGGTMPTKRVADHGSGSLRADR